MLQQSKLILLLLVLLSMTLPTQAQDNQISEVKLPADLDRVLRDYEKGWQGRDAQALAAIFTPDGFILRPGHRMVRGRDNIEESYATSGGPLHLRAYDYAISDSIGYIIGGYGISPESPDFGKYVLTLRKLEDGKWYIVSDMDNGNQ